MGSKSRNVKMRAVYLNDEDWALMAEMAYQRRLGNRSNLLRKWILEILGGPGVSPMRIASPPSPGHPGQPGMSS